MIANILPSSFRRNLIKRKSRVYSVINEESGKGEKGVFYVKEESCVIHKTETTFAT